MENGALFLIPTGTPFKGGGLTSLMESPSESINRYEGEYQEYRHGHLLDPVSYERYAFWAHKKLFANTPPEDYVFEFGAGLGQNIYFCKNRIGFDISNYATEFCRAKGIQMLDDLADAKHKSFDVVISSHNLEHLEQPLTNLQFLRQLLKDQGTLYLVLPVQSSPKDVPEQDIDGHLYCWNSTTIGNLLARAGLTMTSYNEQTIGSGVTRLWFLNRFSPDLYYGVTRWVGGLRRRPREMLVRAKKK
jgi:SAM-dependent methyltransferase